MKNKYIYIFFLFFFVLWRPIHLFIFPYDGGGRLISILAIVFVLFGLSKTDNFSKKGKYFDLPFLLWVFWVNINTFFFNPVINPNIESTFVFFQITSLPFIIYYGFRLNFKNVNIIRQWQWYFLALIIYLAFVIIFERFNSETNRLGNYLNSNEISWVALLTLFSSFIILKKKYVKGIIIILAFMLIILTASKKALLSFILFFGLKFLFTGSVPLVKRISTIAFFSIVLWFVFPIVIENTYMGERIHRSIEKNQNATDESELFDGRAEFYIKGIEYFNNKPFVGIGLTNFLVVGEMEEEAHSEYVIQFAELGIIGIVLFLLFHYRIIKSLIKISNGRRNNYITLIILISFITFYFMFLGRWVYDDIPYNIFLALTVNTILSNKKSMKVSKIII